MRALFVFLYSICFILVSGCEKQVRLSNGRIIYQPLHSSYGTTTQNTIIQQRPIMQPVSDVNTAFTQEGVVLVKNINSQHSYSAENVNTNAFIADGKNTNTNDIQLPSTGKTQDNVDYNGSLLQQAIIASRQQPAGNVENYKSVIQQQIEPQKENKKPLNEEKKAGKANTETSDDRLKNGLYIQIGSFNDKHGASIIQKQALSVGLKSTITIIDGQHHVLIGPYKIKEEGAEDIKLLDSINVPYFWKEI